MMINARGVALIRHYESLSLRAYLCPAGVPTIGWGTTKGVTQEDVERGRTITPAQAQTMFEDDLVLCMLKVSALCKTPTNSNELAALVSCAYNIGVDGLAGSSLLRAHNRGDHTAAAKAFGLWDKARIQGRLTVLAGLTARRAAEAALYLEPVALTVEPIAEPAEVPQYTVARPLMPQAVAPEKPLSQSSIVQAGGLTALVSALALAKEVAEQLGALKGSLEWSGAWVVPATLAIGCLAAGYVVWQRLQQRREGRA